jgi:hypothetical protein
MMSLRQQFRLFVGLVAVLGLGVAWAAGSSNASSNFKIMRRLIVQGERPEISVCLTEVAQHAALASGFEKIVWDDHVSDQAVLQEHEEGRQLVRTIHFPALGLVHSNSALSLNQWRPVQVQCEQIDEGQPRITAH